MPQLRQNIATKEWIIIATERAGRPEDFINTETKKPLPPHSDTCPFCTGNEYSTPPETFAVRKDGAWLVRVTPNKYPALRADGTREHHFDGIKHWMDGIGIHEVIVETPRHDLSIATMGIEDLVSIVETYRQRYLSAMRDDDIELALIFKNHGISAGTSLEHSHSQLIATPIVPLHIRHRIKEAMDHFDEYGECVFCRLLNEEIRLKERVIYETEHFAAFVLYAAHTPFHTWILPKRHESSFGEISPEETRDLATVLKVVLAKLYIGLKDPDYNYVIHSLPGYERKNYFYHWYLSLVPRITKAAGFELGSGMFINTSLPEEGARFLKSVTVTI